MRDVDLYAASRLRERRQFLHLPQHVVARALGITQTRLADYEEGRIRINAAMMYVMSRVLKVPVFWFYEKYLALG